ncbi:unnamed protein product [Pylaiella littoralis]
MLVISRTLRLGCLAFRNGCGIPYSSTLVLRPAAHTLPHPMVTPLSPLSQILVRCCSSRGLSMSGGDVGDTTGGSSSADGGLIQPRVPVSSITAFGQGLGQEQLQSLGKEMEASSEGERLTFPFVGKMYDISNAALFFAHNGRLDSAQEQLKAGFELMSSELDTVDNAGSKDGMRQERVSGCLENLIKAKAFVHFLKTGQLLRKSEVGGDVEDGEYLGAAMRLTAELSRYAITQASILDRSSILASASLCRGIFGEVLQFDLRNGPLRKKFDVVKYDVRKVDDVLYELALLGGGGGGDGGETGSGSSRKRKERKEEEEEQEEKKEKRKKEKGERLVLDAEEFGAVRVAMTAFDEKRETVIKRTRDIQKWSKLAIYSLHRGDSKKAEKQLSDCRKAAEDLLPLINETPRLRMGAFSCSMEEFAEARLYELWLKEKRLATRAEVGLVDTEEYLGGLLDLTGELNRFAVARATERDAVGVKECLETVLVVRKKNLCCVARSLMLRSITSYHVISFDTHTYETLSFHSVVGKKKLCCVSRSLVLRSIIISYGTRMIRMTYFTPIL